MLLAQDTRIIFLLATVLLFEIFISNLRLITFPS
jgi:hypothetical protein